MKKIIISFTLLVFAIPGFSQLLKPVKIDSLVTVSLPANYQKKDTLGQQIVSAKGLSGFMVVIRAANPKSTPPLKKERDLNEVLKDYVKGIQGQSGNGSTQNVRDTTIGTLKAKIFTLQTDDGNGDIQFRNFILLYTTDATYTFEYAYPNNRIGLIKDEYKAYVSSIKFSPQLQRNDQYVLNTKGMSPTLKIALFGGGGLIIVIVIILIVRKKKRRCGKRK
jgi:hypothetical protein